MTDRSNLEGRRGVRTIAWKQPLTFAGNAWTSGPFNARPHRHVWHVACLTCHEVWVHDTQAAAEQQRDQHRAEHDAQPAVTPRELVKPRWTDEELEILHTHSIADTARLTGRTRAAVACKRMSVRYAGNPRGPNSRKTHCLRGHELTEENVYIRPSTGSRSCRTCRRQHKKNARAAKATRPTTGETT